MLQILVPRDGHRNDAITSENRRLQQEVAVLRERVAALERSKWWRLHPRFLALRLSAAFGGTRNPTARDTAPGASDSASDRLIARFHEDVTARGTFSEDWFSPNIPNWEPTLRELEGRPSKVLEIGSFEGLSACYVLWRLPAARVTCIDTFEGSPENIAYGESVADLEARFDRNVALVDISRVRKLRGDSRRQLLDLADEHGTFNLVYVDGSHFGLDVVVDASLSWPLVSPGGVVIFDDYKWAKLGDDPLTRPGPAVDSFLALVSDHAEVLLRAGQVAVRKID